MVKYEEEDKEYFVQEIKRLRSQQLSLQDDDVDTYVELEHKIYIVIDSLK